MVGGDVGRGHQDGRLGNGGELRDGGGPRPAHHHVGGRHHQGHVVDILPHLDAGALQLHAPAEQLLLHPGEVPARPVDVAEGSPLLRLPLQEVHHAAVHHLRPQGPPVGQQERPVVSEPQLLPGLLPGVAEEVPPHRGAGDHHPLRVVVVGAALLKAHHHTVHHLAQGLGGEAGDGVGLVDGGGDLPAGGLLDHGEGGVAPGAHHQVGLELIHNAPGLALGLLHVHQRPKVVGDVRRSQGAVEVGDGHRLDGIALLGHQTGLHPPVRPHKEHPAARVALLKDAGQGHRRIHMPGRPAAGKQNVHANTSFELGIRNSLTAVYVQTCLGDSHPILHS